MKNWKLSDIKFVSKNLHLTDRELSEMLGVNKTTVSAFRKRHGLIKTHCGYFSKGHTPFNKGLPQSQWLKDPGNSVKTRFQKGRINENRRPLNTVFEIPDSTGKAYLFIKLSHNRQFPYGRYVWETTTGEKLTKGDLIKFKDGNQKNCVFENLIKISRVENCLLNTNRKKAGDSLRKTWAVVKTFEDFGLTPPYKFRTNRAS